MAVREKTTLGESERLPEFDLSRMQSNNSALWEVLAEDKASASI
jgi:hypothetical protein